MSTDKICKKCKRALPQTEYYTTARGWNYVVCKDCCRKYGREQYARKHKSPYKYYYDPKKGCMVDNTGYRPKTYWSKDMLDILKKYYPVTPNQEVADMIGVNKKMLQCKVKELGYTKGPEYLRHSLSERRKIARLRLKLKRAKNNIPKEPKYRNNMKTLQEYTDEELREELKRRAQERRKNQKHEITYVEFEATICGVDNTLGYKCNGDTKYIPFCFWKYRIKDCSLKLANGYPWIDYHNKQGCFKRDSSPQIGDRVKLRYRKTKCGSEIFCLNKAKIVEIIK